MEAFFLLLAFFVLNHIIPGSCVDYFIKSKVPVEFSMVKDAAPEVGGFVFIFLGPEKERS